MYLITFLWVMIINISVLRVHKKTLFMRIEDQIKFLLSVRLSSNYLSYLQYLNASRQKVHLI